MPNRIDLKENISTVLTHLEAFLCLVTFSGAFVHFFETVSIIDTPQEPQHSGLCLPFTQNPQTLTHSPPFCQPLHQDDLTLQHLFSHNQQPPLTTTQPLPCTCQHITQALQITSNTTWEQLVRHPAQPQLVLFFFPFVSFSRERMAFFL